MQPRKAHVVNAQVVLDDPTPLPEGAAVEIRLVEAEGEEHDNLDDEERARLHAALDRSVGQAQAGQRISADVVMSKLRAQS